MNYADMQMVKDTARRLTVLERKYSAMAELMGRLINRKSGRPSAIEVAELERLQQEMTTGSH